VIVERTGERKMNNLGMRVTLTLGLLALAATPVHGDQYIVEPIVDTVNSEYSEPGFSEGELDQILAPIALYPDALLSKVLIASTYPLEIVEAARWSRQNSHLEGENAVAAVADKDWDPSVKALVAFPDLLARMDEDLDWTRRLGDAMLYQEAQVMDSIQFLRARADAAGSLADNEYTRVIREEETIIIEPVRTRVVHVPYYDPYVVYGPWWRPAYPPVYWAAPSYYYYGYPGFWWSSGIHLHSGFFFSSFYWPQRSVVIVSTPRFHRAPRHISGGHIYGRHFVPGQRWKHNPVHRRGVAYRHGEVRQRFDQPRLRAGPSTRWPLESGTAHSGERRTDRGSRSDRDWSRGERPDGQWRERRTDSGEQWRDRRAGLAGSTEQRRGQSSGATRSDGTSRRSASDEDEPRLSAGPRTLRPNVTGMEQRLRDTRRNGGAATTQSTPPGSAAWAQQRQRAASAAPRAGTPAQRAPSSPRSAAPAQVQRQASPAPRASAPRAQSRTRAPSRSSAAPAPAPQSQAMGSSGGHGNAAAPGRGAQSGTGGNNRRLGGYRQHD
jgi:hypothetical protein